MSTTVPPIFALHHPQPKLSVVPRLVAGVISILCLTVLIIATRLDPDPRGVETHLQLGLAPCGMLRSTGLPCIACGMTTSFAHLAHGNVAASFVTQPAGTVFAFLTGMAFWIGLYIAFTGRPSARLVNQLPLHLVLLGALGIALVGWAYKMIAVWHSTRA